jgi:hypothetical protein
LVLVKNFGCSPNQCGSEPAREEARKNDEKTFTIIPVDIHHRNECLPHKNRPVHDQPIPTANPVSEGHIMLIHLLTCLALTAVTLTLFSRFFLDIGHTEEHPS